MLVNKNFYALTQESKVLGLALQLLIERDIKKAVHVFANASESDNQYATRIVQSLFEVGIIEKIVGSEPLDMLPKEISFDSGIIQLINESDIKIETSFVNALMRSYPETICAIFMGAVKQGNYVLVTSMLNLCKDLDINETRNKKGNNALMEAAHQGHYLIISLLFYLGARLDQVKSNNDGYSSIMLAASKGHKKAVRALLNYCSPTDPKFELKRENGLMALIMASQNGHINIVKMLLNEKYSDMQHYYAEIALILAAANGHRHIIEYVLHLKNVNPELSTIKLKNLLTARQLIYFRWFNVFWLFLW